MFFSIIVLSETTHSRLFPDFSIEVRGGIVIGCVEAVAVPSTVSFVPPNLKTKIQRFLQHLQPTF